MSNIDSLFSLDGRVAIVTGAAGVLGAASAVGGLLRAGCTVHAVDISTTQLETSRQSQEGVAASRFIPRQLDITNEAEVIAAVADIHEQAGGIDILINSAAIDPKFETDASAGSSNPGAFTTYSLENWQRSLDVNLTGAFLMTREVCKYMERTGKGAIVNISSTYGLVGPDQRIYDDTAKPDGSRFFKPVDYSATKSALLGFTRALAAYYQGTEIRVNALTPGGVQTDNPDEFVARYNYRTIAGRMAKRDEYAGAIVFLCSEASAYMTGANLVVDGGWTAI